MQVFTRHRLPEAELVRLGVQRVNDALDRAVEKAKRESPAAFTLKLRRDPELGCEVPSSDDADLSEGGFEDLPSYYQDLIVQVAAAEYNIRSDYPAEVAGIFAYLMEEFYSSLNPDATQAAAVTE
jgi:hypothetical protein